jgi:hypothetical protein
LVFLNSHLYYNSFLIIRRYSSMEEQRISNPQDAGSSPATGNNFFCEYTYFFCVDIFQFSTTNTSERRKTKKKAKSCL